MPITFSCECGKQLRVADEYAGKRAKCPACGAVVGVPADPFEPVEEPPSKVVARSVPARADEDEDEEEDRPRRRPARRDEDDEDDDRPRRRSRRYEDDEERPRRRRQEDDEDEPPRKKKRKKAEEKPAEGTSNNGSVIGGIAMMVGAAVWFVVGLVFFDWIAFYPPVLFVFGLIAFIKGLVTFADKD